MEPCAHHLERYGYWEKDLGHCGGAGGLSANVYILRQSCYPSAPCSQTRTRTTLSCPKSHMSTRRTALGTRPLRGSGLGSTPSKLWRLMRRNRECRGLACLAFGKEAMKNSEVGGRACGMLVGRVAGLRGNWETTVSLLSACKRAHGVMLFLCSYHAAYDRRVHMFALTCLQHFTFGLHCM
jgi:hypothetical protein